MAKRSAKSIRQDKSIKALKAGKRISASGNVYHENRANRSDKDLRKKFAKGGSVDAPTVYVADLNAYNNGKLVGEHIDLTDYSSGSEVMDKIHELTEKWAKDSGEAEVEYAVHDFEGFPKSFYHESMGEDDFDKVIEFYQKSEDSGIPMDVVEKWIDETGSDIDSIEEAYQGSFKDEEDFAYDLVQQLGGVSGINNPEYYLYVSDTDRRIVAGEEYDRVKEDLEYESELSEEEIEERADEAYNEWYEGLNDPYSFLVDEQGLYDGESLLKTSFVQFDYEKFAKELFMTDYTSIRGKDGDTYVFTNNYEKGGEIKKYKRGGEVKIDNKMQDEIKKLRAVVNSSNIGEALKAKAQARIDMLEEKSGKSSAPSPTAKQKKKVATVMKEFKKGKLTSHGKKVKKPKQAVAIALSEAGLSKKKKSGETAMEYAKRTRKAGESWKDAVKRASKELKNGGKPIAKKIKRTVKSAKPVAKKIKRTKSKAKPVVKKIKRTKTKSVSVAKKIKRTKKKEHLTGSTSTGIDKTIKALKPGKRISKKGKTYYERRANRADLNRTKKL